MGLISGAHNPATGTLATTNNYQGGVHFFTMSGGEAVALGLGLLLLIMLILGIYLMCKEKKAQKKEELESGHKAKKLQEKIRTLKLRYESLADDPAPHRHHHRGNGSTEEETALIPSFSTYLRPQLEMPTIPTSRTRLSRHQSLPYPPRANPSDEDADVPGGPWVSHSKEPPNPNFVHIRCEDEAVRTPGRGGRQSEDTVMALTLARELKAAIEDVRTAVLEVERTTRQNAEQLRTLQSSTSLSASSQGTASRLIRTLSTLVDSGRLGGGQQTGRSTNQPTTLSSSSSLESIDQGQYHLHRGMQRHTGPADPARTRLGDSLGIGPPMAASTPNRWTGQPSPLPTVAATIAPGTMVHQLSEREASRLI